MKTLVKEYMKTHRVMVKYLRDRNGFKKGVVVAIDENRYGWSLVAKSDYAPYTGSFMEIPSIKRALKYGAGPEDVFNLHVFNSIRNGFAVQEPMFNKNVALDFAISRAMNAPDPLVETSLPADPDLLEGISFLLRRAEKFFKKA